MKAREQSNVMEEFLLWQTRIMRDESAWLVISDKGQKDVNLKR